MAVIGSTPTDHTPGHAFIVPVVAGCAALLAVAVYVNALQNPFVYDDFRLIVENPSILNLRDLKSVIVRDITRPLVNVSYAVDTMIWGRVPLGYHVTNLVLHAINVILVFWVALLAADDRRRQARDLPWTSGAPHVIGFASAAVFAVHPMMTEAVGYVTGRSEVLFSFFFLLGLLSGRRWMLGGGRWWWAACVASWIAGVLAKETAAMLPAVLLAYDWFVLEGDATERRRRFLRLELPMLALALTAGLARIAVLKLIEFPGPGADARYALVEIELLWRYLALFLVPRGQSIFHPVTLIDLVSLRAAANIAALAGLLALAWRLRRAHGLVGFGLVWFILLLVPPAVLFTLGRGEAMVERRTYLPAAGLFLIVGYSFGGLWARAGRQRMLAALTAGVFIASLGFLTVMRNVMWQNPVALTREAARLAPGQWLPRVMVGEAFRQRGQCPDAAAEYRVAIDMRPREEFPYTRLAGCLIEMRQLDQAEGVLQDLRAVNPMSQDASMGLGVLALLEGRFADARTYLREAVDRDPPRPRATLLLALMDGALPSDETRRVCDELRAVAGPTMNVEMCQSNSHQVHSGPGSSPAR